MPSINGNTAFLEKVVELMKEELHFSNDFFQKITFESPKEFDERHLEKWKENSRIEIMQDLFNEINELEDFTTENIENTFKDYYKERNRHGRCNALYAINTYW